MNKELSGLRDDELSGMRARWVLKWVLRTVLGFFVLLILLFVVTVVYPVPFQFLALLLFGWITYLHRVLPEMTFNPEIAMDAAIALALAIYGFHCVLRSWSKPSKEKPARWHFGWTLKITVMVLLLFATSIASIGMVHQIAWLCREPKLVEMVGMSKQAVEICRMKQVGSALRQFASDNQGQFPKKLDDLFPAYLTTRKLFFTSALDDDPPQPIIYYTGYSDRDNTDKIILASPRLYDSPRGRSRVVVYLDDAVAVIRESDFEQATTKQKISTHGQ
jgi:hypothetical protein